MIEELGPSRLQERQGRVNLGTSIYLSAASPAEAGVILLSVSIRLGTESFCSARCNST